MKWLKSVKIIKEALNPRLIKNVTRKIHSILINNRSNRNIN